MTRTTRRPSRRTRLATAAVLAPLALGLAACGGDGDDDVAVPAPTVTVTATPSTDATDDTTDTSDTYTSAAPSSSAATTGGGTLETAAETALAAVDGTVFTVDREDDGGWEVSVISADGTDNEVGIAADGTTVTRGPSTDNDDDGDDQAERERLLGASIDHLAAIQAAQGSAGGATLTGVDLDEDNGTATWEVQYGEDTGSEITVDVDASTGEVLRTENDD